MAGKNVILEAQQILFKKGDKSDGMYIVRNGELKVFLEEASGQEVALATVPAGGMIGEMALFDNKPRSASVKAVSKAEVTFISGEDFQKLTLQIPRWFTSLMTTLVGRLRTTNDRLQELESKSPSATGLKKIYLIQRILHLLDLLWHKDADKKGKEWTLELKPVRQVLCEQFCEDPNTVDKIVQVLVAQGLYELKKNEFKNEVLLTNNRGDLTRILSHLVQFSKNSPRSSLGLSCIEILDALQSISTNSGFDMLSANLATLEQAGKDLNCKTIADWKKSVLLLSALGEAVQVTNAANTGVTVKARKKDLKDVILCHKILSSIYDSLV
ncbi:MAG: Crp/Fnr family transcriptional regulator [Oligoflexales bacterium]|nr:Crp/Fnr family transcriptional regulator [Oligoflexales bacterium]